MTEITISSSKLGRATTPTWRLERSAYMNMCRVLEIRCPLGKWMQLVHHPLFVYDFQSFSSSLVCVRKVWWQCFRFFLALCTSIPAMTSHASFFNDQNSGKYKLFYMSRQLDGLLLTVLTADQLGPWLASNRSHRTRAHHGRSKLLQSILDLLGTPF